jgi:hypothetical protein
MLNEYKIIMEVNIGDRIWMYGGGSAILIVGYILEASPDNEFIGVSPVPYDDFKKLTIMQRANIPINWCPLKYCNYVAHIPYAQIAALDNELEAAKPRGGFLT